MDEGGVRKKKQHGRWTSLERGRRLNNVNNDPITKKDDTIRKLEPNAKKRFAWEEDEVGNSIGPKQKQRLGERMAR